MGIFLSFLFLPLLSFSLVSQTSDGQCVEYVLKNECSSLVGNVAVEESEQQDFFDEYVSLNVSNVRMVPESCRRPYLSYLCQLMFGSFSCESSSNEEQHCLEEQSCLQVSDLCSDYFQLDCSSSFSFSPSPAPPSSPSSSSSSSPTLDCSEEVKEQIEEVKKKPIQVETCLDGSKEEIECCPDPFIFDDNDECVVQCPQYIYGKEIEASVRITSFVTVCLCYFVYISAIVPLCLMTDLRYPNYVLFCAYGIYILSYTMNFLPYFLGGQISYVCGGEKNYFLALENFSDSTRSLLQYSFWVFFNAASFSHWLLFSFNLFCHSMRPSIFDLFLRQPVKPIIIFLVEGICAVLSLGTFLSCLLYGLLNDLQGVFGPMAIYNFPYPTRSSVFREIEKLSIGVYGILSAIFLSLAIILFARRGRHMIYFQWRSIVAVCFWLLVVLLYAITSPPASTDPAIQQYIDCVASHPQIDPSPCQRHYNRPDFDIVYNELVLLLFLLLLMVTFWTNSLIIFWWKELIFSRRLATREMYESEKQRRSYLVLN